MPWIAHLTPETLSGGHNRSWVRASSCLCLQPDPELKPSGAFPVGSSSTISRLLWETRLSLVSPFYMPTPSSTTQEVRTYVSCCPKSPQALQGKPSLHPDSRTLPSTSFHRDSVSWAPVADICHLDKLCIIPIFLREPSSPSEESPVPLAASLCAVMVGQ